ncbi:MAG: ATP-binding protein [Sedimentisphaerales bacterium]|nr:ATP-binding protein [Sedimentisphaerales bacterium]
MYYNRVIRDSWTEASGQFPVLLLTGPRQVGKTTFLQHVCEKGRRYVTLDDPAVRGLANEEPALFLERFSPPVLIDEVQYAPGLFSYIKMVVDVEKKPGLFWLTGSQQFLMMKGITETLAGRVAIMNLLGFSLREGAKKGLSVSPFLPIRERLKEREGSVIDSGLQSLYKKIWTGGFPSLIAGLVKNRDLFFSSYLQTYLQRDVKDLSQVGDDMSFLRFIKACAARTAGMLNLSDLARDADVSVNTAKNWLSILQASFQVYLLPPYYTNITKRLVKRPKLYFLDTGLAAFLTEWSSPETLEAGAMSGAFLETFVLSEILKSWWHRGQAPQLYYYRDKDGREIDFLFVQDQLVYPLEVKKSASLKKEWLHTFKALERLEIPCSAGGVACLTKEILPLSDTINAIPVGMI